MRVYNLTDHPTPALEQRGLIGHQIAVGTELVLPGSSCDVPDDQADLLQRSCAHLIELGALSFGAPPQGYASSTGGTPFTPEPNTAPSTPGSKKAAGRA